MISKPFQVAIFVNVSVANNFGFLFSGACSCPCWCNCSLRRDRACPEHWSGSREDLFLPGSGYHNQDLQRNHWNLGKIFKKNITFCSVHLMMPLTNEKPVSLEWRQSYQDWWQGRCQRGHAPKHVEHLALLLWSPHPTSVWQWQCVQPWGAWHHRGFAACQVPGGELSSRWNALDGKKLSCLFISCDIGIIGYFSCQGVRNIASVCLEIGYPTLASVPHSIINGYKKVLAVAVETDYSFPLAEKVNVKSGIQCLSAWATNQFFVNAS